MNEFPIAIVRWMHISEGFNGDLRGPNHVSNFFLTMEIRLLSTVIMNEMLGFDRQKTGVGVLNDAQ